MYNEDVYGRKIQEAILDNKKRDNVRTSCDNGSRNTAFGYSAGQRYPENLSAYPPPPPRASNQEPKRLTDEEIVINVLTEENQKLKKDYGELLKKANQLVQAYRELKTENEILVGLNTALSNKRMKKEAVTKGFADVGKGVQNAWNKTIEWFNT